MHHKEARMHQSKILSEQGYKQSEIASILGVSDRMVRKYLKEGVEPRPRIARISILEPYKPLIDTLLEERPLYNIVLLHKRLTHSGYRGGMTILREYAATIRAKQSVKAALRFETEPGVQAQVDWKEAGVWELDGVSRKVYAFVLLLGYSRKAYVRFTTDMTLPTLLACHVEAFEYLGGIPREILYDNMKTAWLCQGGEWRENPRLLRFASECGFKQLRCKVRRPETKGKVERFIGYLGRNYLEQACDYGLTSLADLNGGVMEWLEEVDAIEIREFCQSRSERFEVEREALKPFDAAHAPEIRSLLEVVVSREGYIRYETNKYSVPAGLLGKTLQLRVHPLSRRADLLHDAVCVRSFDLEQAGKRAVVTRSEDRRGLFELWQKQNRPAKPRQAKNHAKQRNVEVAIRPPSYYDNLSMGGLS